MSDVETKVDKPEIMIIGYIDGWCVLNAVDLSILSGGYTTHSDAVDGAHTRAFRIRQGWSP